MIDPALEVRYAFLRPGQAVARRAVCPVGYVPLGNLEWHGEHNPLGADTLQAEGLSILAAQRGGGLAFPPLWYAEPKRECMEYLPHMREPLAAKMELDPELFREEALPSDARAAAAFYQQLLVSILYQLESLGVRVGVLIAGHYPLIAHATIAVQRFAAEARFRRHPEPPMVPWACLEPDLRFQLEGARAGDHGGKHETSNCLALHPHTVDLALTRDREIVGAGKNAGEATAEYGRASLGAMADLMVRETRHRLEHPDWYCGASYVMQTGKWKGTP
jgi:creatinine amidohydrolase